MDDVSFKGVAHAANYKSAITQSGSMTTDLESGIDLNYRKADTRVVPCVRNAREQRDGGNHHYSRPPQRTRRDVQRSSSNIPRHC